MFTALDGKLYATVEEICLRHNISKQTVYNYVNIGKFKRYGRYLKVSEVDNYFLNLKIEAR